MNAEADAPVRSEAVPDPKAIAESRYAYETLLKCRELELTVHVERSNLCLVIEGALFAFAAPALLDLDSDASSVDLAISLRIASFGVAISVVSVAVIKGADFWISYWQRRLSETELAVLPTISIFRDHPSKSNDALLTQLASFGLKYVSSRSVIRRLFRFLTAVWAILFMLVGWSAIYS